MEKTTKYLIIEGSRDSYGKENLADKTMTVGELIDLLQGCDEDAPVLLGFTDMRTYGRVVERNIHEEDEDE